MRLQLIGAAKTHPGKVREVNEDSVLFHARSEYKDGPIGIIAVADGIGGHKAGDIASKMAITTLYDSLQLFLDNDPSENTRPTKTVIEVNSSQNNNENYLERRLRISIENANKKIFEYAQENPEKAGNLGTTITCGLVWDDMLVIGHVGDSRAYRFRKNILTQLTDDHSFVGKLIREGQLPKEAYYVYPRRNVITRALGQLPHVKVDMMTELLQEGDKILVCTDGLWEMIRDPEIQQCLLESSSPQIAVDTLIGKAVENGGADNIGISIGEIIHTS